MFASSSSRKSSKTLLDLLKKSVTSRPVTDKDAKLMYNTLHDEWDDISGVSTWLGFGLTALQTHYPKLLAMEVESVRLAEPSVGLCVISSEAAAELYLGHIIDYVNTILTNISHKIRRHVQIVKGFPLNSGSPSDRPDWMVVQMNSETNWYDYVGYCPGDTKMGQKWDITKSLNYDTSEGIDNNLRPYLQVVHYMFSVGAQHGRFGFALTEQFIMAMEASHAPENSSQSPNLRPKRNVAIVDYAAAYEGSSPVDDMTQSFQSLSSGSYKPPHKPGFVKATCATWKRGGIASLFALAIISTDPNVDTTIRASYPPFDSVYMDREVYVSTLNGKEFSRKPPDTTQVVPQPAQNPVESAYAPYPGQSAFTQNPVESQSQPDQYIPEEPEAGGEKGKGKGKVAFDYGPLRFSEHYGSSSMPTTAPPTHGEEYDEEYDKEYGEYYDEPATQGSIIPQNVSSTQESGTSRLSIRGKDHKKHKTDKTKPKADDQRKGHSRSSRDKNRPY